MCTFLSPPGLCACAISAHNSIDLLLFTTSLRPGSRICCRRCPGAFAVFLLKNVALLRLAHVTHTGYFLLIGNNQWSGSNVTELLPLPNSGCAAASPLFLSSAMAELAMACVSGSAMLVVAAFATLRCCPYAHVAQTEPHAGLAAIPVHAPPWPLCLSLFLFPRSLSREGERERERDFDNFQENSETED